MADYKLGLVDIDLADIAVDGDIGTNWAPVGSTVAGTPAFSTEEGTTTDFTIEEQDLPVLSILSTAGKKTFSWSSYNIEPANMVRFFGGTAVVGPPRKWLAPAQDIEIEKSMRLKWKNVGTLEIPRAVIRPTIAFSFQKAALSQIDLSADILTPAKEGVPPMTITYDAP